MKQITKNALEVIRIDRQIYKGKDLIDLRIWRKTFRDKDGGYCRTYKGLSIAPDIAQELAKMLIETSKEELPSPNDFGRL